ncbi:MAG: hypothetical protein AVDCRST_MAG66-3712, partial [uncultured Pseudonocardia sp.]
GREAPPPLGPARPAARRGRRGGRAPHAGAQHHHRRRVDRGPTRAARHLPGAAGAHPGGAHPGGGSAVRAGGRRHPGPRLRRARRHRRRPGARGGRAVRPRLRRPAARRLLPRPGVHDQGQRAVEAVPPADEPLLRPHARRGVVPDRRGRRGGRVPPLPAPRPEL